MSNVIKSRLTLIRRIKGYPNPIGLYRCECGVEKEILIGNVKSGHTKSCGCLKKDIIPKNAVHLLKWHPLYKVWCNIKKRCYNAGSSDYYLYGGRGVRVCDQWIREFKPFYDWAILNGWKRGLKVDKDIKGDGLLYSPETCSIVTNKENCNNTRSCVFLEYNGQRKNITQWAESLGISAYTFRYRMQKSNWNFEEYFLNSHKWRK